MKQRLSLSKASYEIKENGRIINARALKIKVIDEISPKDAQTVRNLILAQNAINKIENMRQFTSLTELDISYNDIKNCNELLKLLQLQKLNKIKVNGNPFLLDPLTEEVLQFLLERETDIEILSGETLNQMKDLQEGELKVVFLQNYLRKMSCHEEIMSKKLDKSQSERRSLINEQSTNKNIITKVMPQFYPLIQDPKLSTKIKKQTVSLKKQEQVSFQQAMSRRKQKQQKQVDNLIKDLLLLVEEQDEEKLDSPAKENIQTERISPPKKWQEESHRRKTQQNTKERENRVKQNEASSISSALRRKFEKFSSNIRSQQFQKSKSNLKQNKSQQKLQVKQINQKIQSPQKYDSFRVEVLSPKNQNQISPKMEQNSQQFEANFYSFNRTMPMPFNKIFIDIPKQTTRNQKTNMKKSPKNLLDASYFSNKSKIQASNPLESGKNQRSTTKERIDLQFQFNSLTADLAPAHFYDQYYNHLTKYSPIFALLYSDIASLSSQEKTVLIEALAKDHKQKTVQLYLEQSKLKKLKEVLLQNAANHEKKVESLLAQIQDQFETENIRKNYTTQIQKENSRLNELIKGLSDDISKIKEQNWSYKQKQVYKESEIKRLEADIKQKDQYLEYTQKCQSIGDIISKNCEKRLKIRMIQAIRRRARQHTQIVRWTKKRQAKQANRLINISWSLLKRHLLMRVLSKMKQDQKSKSLLKLCFMKWKEDSVQEKSIRTKQEKYRLLILTKYLQYFKETTTKISAYRKQNKLRLFWANQQLIKTYFYKLHRRTKQSELRGDQKMNIALEHKISWTKKFIVNFLIGSVKDTKEKTKKCHNMVEKEKKKEVYYVWRKVHMEKLLKIQKNSKVQSISKLVQIELCYRKKVKALKKMIKESKEMKQKTNRLLRINLLKGILSFQTNIQQIKSQRQFNQRAAKAIKRIVYKGFINKLRSTIKKSQSFKSLVEKYKKQTQQQEMILQRKSSYLEQKINLKRSRQVFYKLLRNLYNQKVVDFEINQRIELQQTKQLLQKMKTIEQMQIEAIKTQHIKQIQMLQQDQIRKQIQYRESFMMMENSNKELEDMMKLLKNELQSLKQREIVYHKERQLLNEQLQLSEKERGQMKILNQALRFEISNLNHKYDRILETYTQAVIEIQKKQKLSSPLPYEKLQRMQRIEKLQKSRLDKTVQKQKRPTGVVRNGEFVSLRSRIL